MATKLYTIQNEVATCSRPDNTADVAGTERQWSSAKLSASKGNSLVALSTSTLAGTVLGVPFLQSSLAVEHVSDPLSADVTISGTVTLNGWAAESNMSANAGLQCVIQKMDGADGTLTTVLNTEKGTELPVTTRAAQNWTAVPTSTAFKRGDRIRVVWYINDGGGTMASGHTVTLGLSGTTDAADGDTWVQFNENLTFESTASNPGGSTLYLTSTAASEGIDPGSASEKEMWTSRGASSTDSITNTATGWTAGIQSTDTAGGTALEWYSRPLAAFTLGGIARLRIRARESNAAAQASLRAELAVTNSNGTGAVTWAWQSLTDPAGAYELTTTDTEYSVWLSGDDVSVTDGQRLRLRVFVDDSNPAALVTGHTVTVTYSGPTLSASGDSYLILPQSVTEYVAVVLIPSLVQARRI